MADYVNPLGMGLPPEDDEYAFGGGPTVDALTGGLGPMRPVQADELIDADLTARIAPTQAPRSSFLRPDSTIKQVMVPERQEPTPDPGRLVPEMELPSHPQGPVKVGHNVSSQSVEVDKGMLAKSKRLESEHATAVRDHAKMQGLFAKQAAERAKAMAERMRTLGKETEKRQAEFMKKHLEPAEAKLLQDTGDLAKMKIKPDKWWASQGTGQKVAYVAASILGGFAEGFTGGKVRNQAAGFIDRAIQRDIASQKANIVAKQGALQAQRGLVAHYYRQFNDIGKAELFAYDRMHRQMQADIRGHLAEQKGAAGKLQAEAGLLQMQQQRLDGLMRLTAKRKSYSAQYRRPQAADPFAMESKRLRHEIMKARLAKLKAVDMDQATKRKMVTKMSEFGAASEDYKGYLKKMLAMGAAAGWAKSKLPVGTDAQALEAEKALMMGKLVKALFGGHASDADRETLKGRFAGWERGKGWSPGTFDTKSAIRAKNKSLHESWINSLSADARALRRLGHAEQAKPFEEEIQRIKRMFIETDSWIDKY